MNPPEITADTLLYPLFLFLGQVLPFCVDTMLDLLTIEENYASSAIEHATNRIFQLNLVVF